MTRHQSLYSYLAVALLMAALSAGCSYRPLAKHERMGSSKDKVRELDSGSLDSCRVAVGGVILSRYAAIDRFCGVDIPPAEFDYRAQADLWSHHLSMPLQGYAPRFSTWAWPTVTTIVPEEPMAEVHELFASLAILRPDRLALLHEAMPEIDFLVIARIDYNLLEDRSLIQGSGLRGSIGRTIEVTLECYDLRTGESVWRSTDKSHAFGDNVKSAAEDNSRVNVMRPDGGGTEVGIEGVTVSAPALDGMLRNSLDSLVSSMVRSAAVYTEDIDTVGG